MFSNLPFSVMFMLVMAMGTMFSVSSVHWLAIWAGLEVNLIGFLPLLVYQKSVSESESAVKYFVVQALGSSLLLFGSVLSYGSSFSWEVLDSNSTLSILGFGVIVSGLFIKMGLFPFHYWLPSVMAGLPWIPCMLLATWQKIAPLFLILCLLELSDSYLLLYVFCLASAGSSMVGGLGGMNQTQVRALLAYSSIGHLGWIVFGALHGEWVMKVYFSIYLLISLSIFMSLLYVDIKVMMNLDSMKNYSFMQLSVMLLLLSLGGLPPLLGFVSKWVVITVGMSGSFYLFLGLLILGSLMSLFYYLSLFFCLSMPAFMQYELVSMGYNSNSLVVVIIFINLTGGILIMMSNVFNQFYALAIFNKS
uniref:NADH-ubiquinone oxidoreductase chain 2 n=1 Tax=Melo melo TaxID=927631 RepID=A0A6B9MZR1_9CAEN|nr:NADH dehydrogenase subunit 2 [Melo melo]